MPYSGATLAHTAREELGKALGALQEDANVPRDVMAVASNIAQAVGALFEAERASTEPDGKASVRSAIGTLSQTLALLQDVRGQHKGVAVATEVIARSMSALYPLTTAPTRPPPKTEAAILEAKASIPQAAAVPKGASKARIKADPSKPRQNIEANIGATTESNFYVGFSGEIAEGGVFIATYETLPKGTPVNMLVTLPGNFEAAIAGVVAFVRDPLDMSADSEPGMGIAFESLGGEQRELVLRFIRKRPPIFYDE